MNRFKRIVPFLLALIMAAAISVAGCDSCGEGKVKTLQSISVNYDNAKTLFVIGEEFKSDGLVVKASFSVEGSEDEEVTLSAGDYQLDSSAFNKDELGKYPVKVSYTYEGVTKESSYNVEVRDMSDGLVVTLADGVPDTYTLSSTQKTVEIDISKIVVSEVDKSGVVSGEVNDYTAKLYRGQQEIALTDKKAAVDAGAYAIWVEKASEINSEFMRTAFVLIYVNDDMVSFEKKGGTFTQSMGEDVISKTWTFTATYATGATKEISAKDCEFEIDTMTVNKDVKTTVTYNDYNAKGDLTSKSVDITYTINMSYGKMVYTYDYSAIDNSAMENDKTELKQSDLKGVNSFLILGDGSAQYRNKEKFQSADVVEIKNCGFKVKYFGTGTIKIGFSSTGTKNWSRVGLKDEAGNYVEADYEDSSAIRKDTLTTNIYQVYGTSPSELTFNIAKPGTYSIVCEPNKDLGMDRSCRLHSIVMEDNVDDPANIVCDVDFTDTVKFVTANLNKNTAEPVEIKDASGAAVGLSVTQSGVPNANRITEVNGVQVLQLQGTATTAKNSLLFSVKAGKIKVTVKYIANSNRYIDIFSSGGVLGSSSGAQPAEGTNEVAYTVEIDVAADGTLYLGSHSGQINITYLKVEKA